MRVFELTQPAVESRAALVAVLLRQSLLLKAVADHHIDVGLCVSPRLLGEPLETSHSPFGAIFLCFGVGGTRLSRIFVVRVDDCGLLVLSQLLIDLRISVLLRCQSVIWVFVVAALPLSEEVVDLAGLNAEHVTSPAGSLEAAPKRRTVEVDRDGAWQLVDSAFEFLAEGGCLSVAKRGELGIEVADELWVLLGQVVLALPVTTNKHVAFRSLFLLHILPNLFK